MAGTNGYKRRYERLCAPFIMRILAYNHERLSSEYCSCAEGIDISPGGISFKYPKVIQRDAHLKVLIHGIEGIRNEEIMANVKVIWTETKDTLTRRFGARFVKIAPDKKYKIIKAIRINAKKHKNGTPLVTRYITRRYK